MENFRTSALGKIARVIACIVAVPCFVHAQLGPLRSPIHAPQAQSQVEFDTYLEILTEPDPGVVIKKVAAFALDYPASELLGTAYQHQMLAYEKLNSFRGVLEAGEAALQRHPRNLNTLLTLASAIPNGVHDTPETSSLLQRAEEYARLSLEGLEVTKVPVEIPVEHWEILKGQMEAQAHEALGHIATKRGQVLLAITELEKAVRGNPVPQGSQFYRLGIAYLAANMTEPARGVLHRATELGPDVVRSLAETELQKLATGQPMGR